MHYQSQFVYPRNSLYSIRAVRCNDINSENSEILKILIQTRFAVLNPRN